MIQSFPFCFSVEPAICCGSTISRRRRHRQPLRHRPPVCFPRSRLHLRASTLPLQNKPHRRRSPHQRQPCSPTPRRQARTPQTPDHRHHSRCSIKERLRLGETQEQTLRTRQSIAHPPRVLRPLTPRSMPRPMRQMSQKVQEVSIFPATRSAIQLGGI